MNDEIKPVKSKLMIKIRGLLLGLCLLVGVCIVVAYAANTNDSTDSSNSRRLQNGSFEESQTWTSNYIQIDQSQVPSWNTTAYEKKIELLRKNSNYIQGVSLIPTDGDIAAELNADEESTLYQNVTTIPSSIYEWGLDHGARNGTDTMALVIGPKQNVDPSKPSKTGRDQFMQMVDWLIAQGKTSVKTSAGLGEKLTVYSKKFAAGGTFEDNAGNNAFSLTPSTIYTEEWQIWIMASSKANSGTNPWNSYGSNGEGSAGSENESGGTTVDMSKYYLYTVPAGQTETTFGFVSVGYNEPSTIASKAKTYGNFLDNINFGIYHPLSGSSTTHGSAVIGGSDGTAEGEGQSDGYKVTVDNSLVTYVTDGEPLKIQAVIKKDDADAGCEFVGVYYTKQGEDGNPETIFLQKNGNEIEDTGNLTDEQKEGKWIKSTNSDGDTIYTYYLEGLVSATDLHFIFIKSPTITYDSNGGKAYKVDRIYNTNEAENVYSYKPVTDTSGTETMQFISPYVSHAAEGQNGGWKFMGWLLTGDTIDGISDSEGIVNAGGLGNDLLPAVHTIACDYSLNGASNEQAVQYFKIYNENVSLEEKIINNGSRKTEGVEWTDNGETTVYANYHKGLTMVAQWRWLQAVIPRVWNGSTYTDSVNGGTVEISSVTDKDDTNYNSAYNENGGKSYHAEIGESVTFTATAKEGYTFEGWYDASGNLVTTNTTYSYVETKESVNTYYARFSGSVTQTFVRQFKDGDTWKDTDDDSVGNLDRYTYTDAAGTPISSTATAGTGYKFVGWYDSDGKKVDENMLINDGATISYTTVLDAKYYARFETAYTVKFEAQIKQADGTFKTNTTGGKVSVASVTDLDGASAKSTATANTGYKFLGWYDKDGNQLSTDATYSVKITSAINNVTYYARFEIVYKTTVDDKVYLSFIAESEQTKIPSAFSERDAGTDKNAAGYGRENKYGNTIATGFKYSIGNMTNVSTIQITVIVPDSAYVKVGGAGNFKGTGDSILEDSAEVKYNKGTIMKIREGTTLKYYWDASDLKANTKYGFIVDNLYAPGATATITVNGTLGTKVTNDNGVVNTASEAYKSNSHYQK